MLLTANKKSSRQAISVQRLICSQMLSANLLNNGAGGNFLLNLCGQAVTEGL